MWAIKQGGFYTLTNGLLYLQYLLYRSTLVPKEAWSTGLCMILAWIYSNRWTIVRFGNGVPQPMTRQMSSVWLYRSEGIQAPDHARCRLLQQDRDYYTFSMLSPDEYPSKITNIICSQGAGYFEMYAAEERIAMNRCLCRSSKVIGEQCLLCSFLSWDALAIYLCFLP